MRHLRPVTSHDVAKRMEARLIRDGVSLVSKADSKLMRAIGKALFFNPDFMQSYWTTVCNTIYAPARYDRREALYRLEYVYKHEFVHVRQWRKWGPLFTISYLLLPLPLGLAWFRWYWERQAYLEDLKAGRLSADEITEYLWSGYGWPWPKPLMRRWLRKKERELNG